MGLGPRLSCGIWNDGENLTIRKEGKRIDGNPDPYNFKVLEMIQCGPHTLAKIKYPDCTNYEGVKILLFKHTDKETIKNAKVLDPHFTDKNVLKPFARFDPTPEGYSAGTVMLMMLAVEEPA